MAELADSFEALSDPEMMQRAAAVAGGYMGASVAQSTVDPRSPVDVPNEAYGLAVAAGGYAYSPAYNEEVAIGGAVYTLDSLAQRVGIKQRVNGIGGA